MEGLRGIDSTLKGMAAVFKTDEDKRQESAIGLMRTVMNQMGKKTLDVMHLAPESTAEFQFVAYEPEDEADTAEKKVWKMSYEVRKWYCLGQVTAGQKSELQFVGRQVASKTLGQGRLVKQVFLPWGPERKDDGLVGSAVGAAMGMLAESVKSLDYYSKDYVLDGDFPKGNVDVGLVTPGTAVRLGLDYFKEGLSLMKEAISTKPGREGIILMALDDKDLELLGSGLQEALWKGDKIPKDLPDDADIDPYLTPGSGEIFKIFTECGVRLVRILPDEGIPLERLPRPEEAKGVYLGMLSPITERSLKARKKLKQRQTAAKAKMAGSKPKGSKRPAGSESKRPAGPPKKSRMPT